MTDDADKELFRRAMLGTRKLTNDKHLFSKKPKPAVLDNVITEEKLFAADLDSIIDQEVDCTQFARNGISRQVLRKLGKGKYPIECELDLHGLNREQAKDQLLDFIVECTHANIRCARIIHGKGNRSKDNIAVLRIKTMQWLRQFDNVLAYCKAADNDGGNGAMYVLLSRS